jgi:hypothetical protein
MSVIKKVLRVALVATVGMVLIAVVNFIMFP